MVLGFVKFRTGLIDLSVRLRRLRQARWEIRVRIRCESSRSCADFLMARSKSSSRWLQEHVNDPYVKQAQKDGYRSRSSYKLIELNERTD